jgi:hypothetical protein
MATYHQASLLEENSPTREALEVVFITRGLRPTSFSEICELGNVEQIDNYLNNNLKPPIETLQRGMSSALRNDNFEALKYLIEHYPDIAPISSLLWSAINYREENQENIVEHLVKLLDPDQRESILAYHAATSGNQKLVDILYNNGFDGPEHIKNILSGASHCGSLSMFESAWHKLECDSETYSSLLYGAARDGCHSIIDFLLFVNTRFAKKGDQAVYALARKGDFEYAVKLLKKTELKIEAKKYIFVKAAKFSALPVMQMLRNQLDSVPVDKALASAAKNGAIASINYIKSLGLPIENAGECLVLASKKGHADCIRSILELEVLEKDCTRAMREAIYARQLSSAVLLLEEGIPLPKINAQSKTLAGKATGRFLFFVSSILSGEILPAEAYTGDHNSKPGYPVCIGLRVLELIATITSSLGECETLLSQVLENTFERKNKMTWQQLYTSCESQLKNAENLNDLANDFIQLVLLPAHLSTLSNNEIKELRTFPRSRNMSLLALLRPQALQILFADKTAPEIGKMNTVWHQPNHQVPDDLTPMRAYGKWHPLFDPVVVSDNVSVECLTSVKDLKKEGQQMGHCVGRGAYGSRCLEGESHIISIKRSGAPIATVEVYISDKATHDEDISLPSGKALCVRQFQSISNSAAIIWEKFRVLISEDKVEINLKEIGETQNSKIARSAENICDLETITGNALGSFPFGVLRHFQNMKIPARRGLDNANSTPFLSHEVIEAVISIGGWQQ